MNYRFRFRRGIASLWTSKNPILGPGEPGFEKDTLKWKVGDGTSSWVDLEYQPGSDSSEDATTTIKGIIEIATLTEVATGTDSIRAVTSEGVRQERLALKSEILGGVSAPYDTLNEIYEVIVSIDGDVSTIASALSLKADSSDVLTLSNLVETKADASTVATLITTVGTKADSSTVATLTTTVGTKANSSDVYTKTELGNPETDLSAAYVTAKA